MAANEACRKGEGVGHRSTSLQLRLCEAGPDVGEAASLRWLFGDRQIVRLGPLGQGKFEC